MKWSILFCMLMACGLLAQAAPSMPLPEKKVCEETAKAFAFAKAQSSNPQVALYVDQVQSLPVPASANQGVKKAKYSILLSGEDQTGEMFETLMLVEVSFSEFANTCIKNKIQILPSAP